ncbi:hypothetical protein [Victivallis vadensis]|uniref:Lipoprotein n=1 Tax=Victivallis vadensis TaxID=172901 RepID=A0A2U1AUM9_9BACT|nr:hypothetical protein [Victivallis vadensis]PVY40102.1 hypothetical protein C8D82_118103 [Victivallis vadensis]
MSQMISRFLLLTAIGILFLCGCAFPSENVSMVDRLRDVQVQSAIGLIDIVKEELGDASCRNEIEFQISLFHLENSHPTEREKITARLRRLYPAYSFLDREAADGCFADSRSGRRIVIITIAETAVEGDGLISCGGTITYGSLGSSGFTFFFRENSGRFLLEKIQIANAIG